MSTTNADNTGNTLDAWVSAHGTIDNAVAARITDFGDDPKEASRLASYVLELAYNYEEFEALIQNGTFFTDRDTAGWIIYEARNLGTIVDNVADTTVHRFTTSAALDAYQLARGFLAETAAVTPHPRHPFTTIGDIREAAADSTRSYEYFAPDTMAEWDSTFITRPTTEGTYVMADTIVPGTRRCMVLMSTPDGNVHRLTPDGAGTAEQARTISREVAAALRADRAAEQ